MAMVTWTMMTRIFGKQHPFSCGRINAVRRDDIANLAVLLPLVWISTLKAEIILDEFDLPAVADSNGPTVVEQPHAGDLPGFRAIVATGIANPIGHWRTDSSTTVNSVLHMEARDLVIGSGYGIVGSGYIFGRDPITNLFLEVDFTEGGLNDAIRLDFAYSRGPTPVRNIRIITVEQLTAVLDPLPLSEEPFSVLVPFGEFVDRGGNPPGDRFSRVDYFSLQFQSAGNPIWPIHDDRGWQVGLERISIFPEPNCALLAGEVLLLAIICCRFSLPWRSCSLNDV